MSSDVHRKALAGFRWREVDLLPYKPEGSAPFRDITRQVLFGDPAQPSQLRYFEIGAGGWSTLERHRHTHAVMILRGQGRCLVGGEILQLDTLDLVSVPPLTWHQFRAGPQAPLGFLCMVDSDRDRPELPGDDDLRQLRELPGVGEFLRSADR